jgi:UDP-N-acetyl-D-glucosamine dehydrogenase
MAGMEGADFERLQGRIVDRTAVVGVIGLGYVGLPLAMGFGASGYEVIGLDIDTRKVEALSRGVSVIQDVSDAEVAAMMGQGRFRATSAYADLAAADAVFICVPTPFTAMKAPDLSYIEDASRRLADFLRRGQLVVLQSTTYPGTTEEVVMPILAGSGLEVGVGYFLAFSPERIDPGQTSSAGFNVENTPKVVGGVTPACLELAASLLSRMIATVHRVSTPRAAEMTKLLENTFRSVNIALVNELAILAERMDIDIWEVIDAAATKPFGFMPFRPGPGVGGHCIPVDPFYLSWKAREFDYYTKFIELAAEVNIEMSDHAVGKVTEALNQIGRSVSRAKVLVVGVAFKPNVDDARNSPAEPIVQMLVARGADVSYHDPYIPQIRYQRSRHHDRAIELESVELTEQALSSADCVLILTNHRVLDLDRIVEHASLVVDTVNATRSHTSERIVRLGAPTGAQRPLRALKRS